MDLSAQYLGLKLRNPLVASASPMAGSVDGVVRLAARRGWPRSCCRRCSRRNCAARRRRMRRC